MRAPLKLTNQSEIIKDENTTVASKNLYTERRIINGAEVGAATKRGRERQRRTLENGRLAERKERSRREANGWDSVCLIFQGG
jgi:hypothetical protein